MMKRRIFGLTATGKQNGWSADLNPPYPVDKHFRTRMASGDCVWVYVEYDPDEPVHSRPVSRMATSKTDGQFYIDVCQLIEAGQFNPLRPKQEIIDEVQTWARGRGLPLWGFTEENAMQPAPMPPARKGVPRTVIVQDWLQNQDKGELVARAWEATVIACGGRVG